MTHTTDPAQLPVSDLLVWPADSFGQGERDELALLLLQRHQKQGSWEPIGLLALIEMAVTRYHDGGWSIIGQKVVNRHFREVVLAENFLHVHGLIEIVGEGESRKLRALPRLLDRLAPALV